MGGSFNPPTIAHLKIMQTALNSVNAKIGFMIPVSFPYLKRKMVKAGSGHLCLPNDLRIRMLEAMIATDGRIQIFTEAMGEPFSDDVGIMKMMQHRYPDSDIYYVAGVDKLDLLNTFARKSDFFQHFKCILYARDNRHLMEEIAARDHLMTNLDSFILVSPPPGIEGISATSIREHLFDVDAVAELLHPDVVPMLRKLKPEDFPEEILQFKDKYAFLSNDFPVEVTYKEIVFLCATSAFLSTKCEEPAERNAISRMGLNKAKQKYNAKPGSVEWEEHKTEIMEEIVHLKFHQHPELMKLLTATDNQKLINGEKKDEFWGVNLITWEGENHLGTILMKIRAEGRTQ